MVALDGVQSAFTPWRPSAAPRQQLCPRSTAPLAQRTSVPPLSSAQCDLGARIFQPLGKLLFSGPGTCTLTLKGLLTGLFLPHFLWGFRTDSLSQARPSQALPAAHSPEFHPGPEPRQLLLPGGVPRTRRRREGKRGGPSTAANVGTWPSHLVSARCAEPGLKAFGLRLWMLLHMSAVQRLGPRRGPLGVLDPSRYPQHLLPGLGTLRVQSFAAVVCVPQPSLGLSRHAGTQLLRGSPNAQTQPPGPQRGPGGRESAVTARASRSGPPPVPSARRAYPFCPGHLSCSCGSAASLQSPVTPNSL